MIHRALPLFLVVLCLLSPACALNYGKQWRDSAASSSDGLTGAWEGRWLSHSNGHHGRLRCIVTEAGEAGGETGAEDQYRFYYWATWGRIYRNDYDVIYTVTEAEDGSYRFAGASDLGRLAGGVYTHEGTATSEEFRATYQAKWDHGILEMARPE